MEGFSYGKMMAMAMAVTALVMSCVCVSGETLHRVGGGTGWAPGVNYTEWSKNEQFYVDDWIGFYYDKRMYNVLEVNQTGYDSCNDKGFIKNITRGGRDVYQLTHPGPYYFLSGGGYCWGGMKLAVFVQPTPPQTPAPSHPPTNASPSLVLSLPFTILLLSLSLSLVIY